MKLFELGQTVATLGALDLGVNLAPYFQRHQTGDWDNVPPEDAQENELSVKEGYRILSSYDVNGQTLWIITECDRSVSTALLPAGY